MEIDPLYCDVILMRWGTLTGRQPALEGTGDTFEAVTESRKPPLSQLRAGAPESAEVAGRVRSP